MKNYETLAPVYKHNRREMPFKWIKITTRTTPKLALKPNWTSSWGMKVILACQRKGNGAISLQNGRRRLGWEHRFL